MPLVRVAVSNQTTADQRAKIADAIYEAMRATINIPEGDKFILVTPHGEGELFIDPKFQGMNRTADFLHIQIFLSVGRTIEQKQALYASVAEKIHTTTGISTEDVMLTLTENNYPDWSFGKGVAQFVLNPPAWVKVAEGSK